MSALKSAFKTVKKRFSTPPQSTDSSHTNLPNGRTSQTSAIPRTTSAERLRTTELKRAHEDKQKQTEFLEARQRDDPKVQSRYGDLPLVQIHEEASSNKPTLSIAALDESYIGQEVTLKARVHTSRAVSAKLAFTVLRQQIHTVQAVLTVREGIVSETFVRWAEHLRPESIVVVSGTIQAPREPVTSTTVHTLELLVDSLYLVSQPTQPLPFKVYDDELSRNPDDEVHHISDRARFDHRLVDLRSPVTQCIFRVNAAVCSLFRSHLDAQGFMEIHSPKLQAGATESGSSVFSVKYFGRTAFLAQSPQLAKQMAISADFGRVYEIGPIFRAENSNTHRHMTEFTGLDLEMAIDQHYHEALRVIDGTLKAIFKGVYERCRKEIDILQKSYPHQDLVWPEETVVLPFKDGIKLLRDSGWKDDGGEPPSENEDLSTRDEIELGRLVKEKYNTDYYILDKFPASARPFYTMPDPTDKNFTNSFDIFVRGQEILSGGQRIHDAALLEARMQELGIQPQGALKEYAQAFRYGCPPHAGGGIGLERIIMLLLNLGNIRHASLFPRDPKSLAVDFVPPVLRHADADTAHPPWEFLDTPPASFEEIEQHMPLAKLIANYGDASNTSWLDDRYEVWRHSRTGAAIGFVRSHHFAIVVGDPLCDANSYAAVIADFLPWIKHNVGKPIWMLVSGSVEGILGGDLDWKSVSCVAEDRTDPLDNKAKNDPAISRKIRHATKEGIKLSVSKLGEAPSEEVRQKVDKRIVEWMESRKGKKQVHLTDVAPWRDSEHRIYIVGSTGDGEVHTMVILTQLSPAHGFQVKWALDFPKAPSGAIEHSVMTALDVAAENGAKSVTFGAGASSSLKVEHGFANQRLVIKTLEHTYQTIATELKLLNKSEFRAKMGAYEDPVYVCFSKGTLGPKGIRAMMGFLEDGDD